MAEHPPGQACSNCRYFCPRARYYNADGTLRYQDTEPVCKLLPPPSRPGGTHGEGYPETHAQQWCGGWAPADPDSFEDAACVIARLVLLGDRAGVYGLVDKIQEARS